MSARIGDGSGTDWKRHPELSPAFRQGRFLGSREVYSALAEIRRSAFGESKASENPGYRFRFERDVFRLLSSRHPRKSPLAQLLIGGDVGEFDLANELRLDPLDQGHHAVTRCFAVATTYASEFQHQAP